MDDNQFYDTWIMTQTTHYFCKQVDLAMNLLLPMCQKETKPTYYYRKKESFLKLDDNAFHDNRIKMQSTNFCALM